MVEQGSAEWHALRLKRFTGSEYSRLMGEVKRAMTEDELKAWKLANPTSKALQCVDPHLLSDGAMTYVQEVASERETGLPACQEFENDAMRWGKEHEPHAKALYAAAYDIVIDDIDFVPYLDYAGASPDGLIGETIGCEIKCPINRAKHMQYRTLENADDLKENHKDHYWQCLGGMLATGRKLWKFMSYHPDYPALKQLKIINVPWNDEDINLLKIKLTAAEKACQFLVNMK
jgi:hypothetical protein